MGLLPEAGLFTQIADYFERFRKHGGRKFSLQYGGGRWKRFGSGLPNVPVFSIVANAKTIWLTIGTHGRGSWRIHLPE